MKSLNANGAESVRVELINWKRMMINPTSHDTWLLFSFTKKGAQAEDSWVEKAGWQLFVGVQPGRGADEGVERGRKGGVWWDREKWKWNESLEYLKEEVWTVSCWQTSPQRRTHTALGCWWESFYTIFFKLCHDCESFFVSLEVFLAAPGLLSLCFHSVCCVPTPPFSLSLPLSPSLTYYFEFLSSHSSHKISFTAHLECVCFQFFFVFRAFLLNLKYRWQSESKPLLYLLHQLPLFFQGLVPIFFFFSSGFWSFSGHE